MCKVLDSSSNTEKEGRKEVPFMDKWDENASEDLWSS
jgi:hypothetical protein